MKLKLMPESLEDKVLRKEDLDRYFSNTSIENLVLLLRSLRRSGCLNFEVTMDKQYLSLIKDRETLALRSDVLIPINRGFNITNDTYGLGRLHTKFKNEEPLSESDIVLVAESLPEDIALKYLGFKLFNIDWEAYEEAVTENPIEEKLEDSYDRVEFNGLTVDGGQVSYRGREMQVSFQHRQVIRLLVSKQGGLCTRDDFLDDYWSIFNRQNYANIDATLRKLISAVRGELVHGTGKDLIVNEPNEGWKLSS